jgi:hypothetical protein
MPAVKTWIGGLVLAALGVAGCGSRAAPPGSGDTGQIEVALSATAGAATYVLANATFDVVRTPPPPAPGDMGLVLDSSTDPLETVLTAGLPVGRYTVTLGGPWQIQRLDPMLGAVPVQATLLSANPATVSIFSGQTTTVTFQFQTTNMPITFGPGTLDVGIGVGICDPAPPPGAELNAVANSSFEIDTSGWTRGDGTALSLSNDAHCGLHSGRVPAPGAMYVLPQPGPATSFAFSAWVKHDSSAPRDVMFLVASNTIPQCADKGPLISETTVPPNVWTRISGTAIIGGSGCMEDDLVINLSGAAPTDQLLIDDVYAIPGQTASESPDTTPPVVTIGGVTDGEVTGTLAVTPTVSVTDDHLGQVMIALDGAPFLSGTPVVAEGHHELRVLAMDTSANTTTTVVTFTIDRTPPTLTVTSPAKSARVADNTVTVTGTVADLTLAGLTIDGAPATVAPDGSFAETLALTQGANAIVVRAVDGAGNASEVTVDVRSNISPPTLTIVSPTDGAVVSTTSVLVTGSASPADPQDVVTVSVDGVSTPVSSTGMFSQPAPLVSGVNAITVVALDGYGLSTAAIVKVTVNLR